jgi:cystic fibrosis transmembrane conductance regulator
MAKGSTALKLHNVELALSQQRQEPPIKNDGVYERASFFSKLFFTWINGLIATGAKETLEAAHLADLLPRSDAAAETYNPLQKAWAAEKERSKPSLMRALIHAYWWQFAVFGPYIGIEAAVELAAAVFLGSFVESISEPAGAPTNKRWLYGTAIMLLTAAKAMLHAHYFFGAWRFGLKLRVVSPFFIRGLVNG